MEITVNITGLTIKTMEKHQLEFAEYSLLPTPAVTLRRFDDSRSRFYYYAVPENGQLVTKTAIGVTSLLSLVMPQSSFLTDWKVNTPEYKHVLKLSADYGTMLHRLYGEWLINKKVDKDVLEAARQISLSYGASYDLVDKDMLAFLKFQEDYDIQPMLVEAMLLSPPIDGESFAMTIDLLASYQATETVTELVAEGMYVRGKNKGQPKMVEKKVTKTVRKIMLCDFKSNVSEKEQKSYYQSHLFQLMSGKEAVEYNYDIKVDMICNMSPLAWKKNPGYSLKEWQPTDQDRALLDSYIAIGKLQGFFRPSGYLFVGPEFTEATKSSDYSLISYDDYARNQFTSVVTVEDSIPPEFLDSDILSYVDMINELT